MVFYVGEEYRTHPLSRRTKKFIKGEYTVIVKLKNHYRISAYKNVAKLDEYLESIKRTHGDNLEYVKYKLQ